MALDPCLFLLTSFIFPLHSAAGQPYSCPHLLYSFDNASEMALTDTAIFLIFLATLIIAIALLFFLRRFIPDCREKRKANVCQTTKVDEGGRKRKFDLETGSATDSQGKETTKWKERVARAEGRVKKARKTGQRRTVHNDQMTVHDQRSDKKVNCGRVDSKHEVASSKHGDGVRGNLPFRSDIKIENNSGADSPQPAPQEVVFPKQSDVEFEDIPLEFPRRDGMLEECEGERW